MAKKRRPKKVVTLFVSLILLTISGFLIYNVVKEITNTMNLKKELAIVEEKLQEVEKENAELVSQREKLQDPAYVQSYARGNYMFSKEGEKIYYLPQTNESK